MGEHNNCTSRPRVHGTDGRREEYSGWGLSQAGMDKTGREAQEHSRPLNMRTGKVLFCGLAPLAGWDRAPEPLSLLEFRTLTHLSILINTALDHSVRSPRLPF